MSKLKSPIKVYLYKLSPCGEFIITLANEEVLLYSLFPIKKIHHFENIPYSIDVKWTLDGKQIIFEFSKNKYLHFNYLVYDAKTFELVKNSVGSELLWYASLPKILSPSFDELKSGYYGMIKPPSRPNVYYYKKKSNRDTLYNYNLYIDTENNINFNNLDEKGLYKEIYYNFSPDGNFISGFLHGFRIWKKTGELITQQFPDPKIVKSEYCIWLNNSQIIFMNKDYSRNRDYYESLQSACMQSPYPIEIDKSHKLFTEPGKHEIFIYDFIKNSIVKSYDILMGKKYSALQLNISHNMSVLAISSVYEESNNINLINLQTGNIIASVNGFIMDEIAVWVSGGSALVYQDNKGHICLYDFLEEQKKNIMLLQLESFRQKKNKLKTPVKLPRLPHELWDLIYDEFSISMIK